MARDRYIRPGTGSDANDGSAQGSAVQTISSGITAARSQADDRWKFEKSPAPVSIGVDITLTLQDDDFALGSAVTTNIDLCETAYTASANVTCSTSSTRKEGSLSATAAFAAGFTTGLAAYRAITLDLSSKQKVSLWVRSSGNLAANTMRLDLCTDTVGATPAHSFTIGIALLANVWHRLTFDNGSAMSAAIQSVGWTALLDPGTVTFFWDNVFATNDLSLNTPIGVGSADTDIEFYLPRSVNGTAGKLDGGWNDLSTGAARGWPNATVTSTAYIRTCFTMAAAQNTNEGGSSGQPVVMSGGWNSSDMTTQEGLTWIERPTSSANALNINHTFMKFERIVFVGGNIGFSVGNADVEFADKNAAVGASGVGISVSTVARFALTGSNYALQGGSDGFSFATATATTLTGDMHSYSNGSRGIVMQTANKTFYGAITTLNNVAAGITINSYQVGFKGAVTTKYNGAQGVNVVSAIVDLWGVTSTNNTATGLSATSGALVKCRGLTTSNNSGGVSVTNGAWILLDNPSVAEASKFTTSQSDFSRIMISRYDGDETDHRIYEENALVWQRETTTVHSPATFGYKATPQAFHISTRPLIVDLGFFAAKTTAFTYSIWNRRDSTNVECKLVLRGPQLGITTQTDTGAGAANTWDELTVGGTPADKGLISTELHFWQGAGSGNIFISDTSSSTQS